MMGLFSNKRGMAGVFISFLLIALLALFAAKGYQNYVVPYVRYALFASLLALAAWLFLAIREWRRPATQEQAPILIFWYFLNFL